MRQDRALELLQGAARLEAELVAQQRTSLAIRLERVGLTALTVEREHQLSTQALLEGVRRDEALELGHVSGAVADRELGVDAVHRRRQPKLLEPADVGLREVELGDVREGLAAPQRERIT